MIISLILAASLVVKPPAIGLGAMVPNTLGMAFMEEETRKPRSTIITVEEKEIFRTNPDGTYRCTGHPSPKIVSKLQSPYSTYGDLYKVIYILACGKNVTPLPPCSDKSLEPGGLCTRRKK